jgi:hypothetical protein
MSVRVARRWNRPVMIVSGVDVGGTTECVQEVYSPVGPVDERPSLRRGVCAGRNLAIHGMFVWTGQVGKENGNGEATIGGYGT